MSDLSVFKAYDIRGVYSTQLTEALAYKIGRAYVDYLNIKEVAVGYDMRISTPKLRDALIQGITDAGANVIDLGMVGSETVYYAIGHFEYPGGIMVTASHNPSHYNGFKLVRKGVIPIGENGGMKDIKQLVKQSEYRPLNLHVKPTRLDPTPAFKEAVTRLVDFTKFKPFKIVVDAGNGLGGELFNKIFSNTQLEIIPMYFEPNGSFPNHEPNPMKPENVAELRKRVVEEKADLGLSLDGDGDRCLFIDENGDYTLGYFIVALLAKKMLEKYPGAKIVGENRLKWAIQDTVAANGGEAVIYRPGHVFLKEKMREVGAVFGGETSSHFFYKDLYFADSSMLSIALMLELMTETNSKLSELFAPFTSKYFISGEINFEVKNADETLAHVKKFYADGGFPIDELDGIAVDNHREWRFSLRKSNTEPLVRLNVEGQSQEIVDKMTKQVEALIKSSHHKGA